MAEFDSVIPAGGSGTLTAKIKTTSTQSGPISKSIAVNTDFAENSRMMLSVTFNLVTAVKVLPRPRINLNGVQGDAPTATLIFRRPDGEKLEITGVESSDELVVVTVESVKIPAEVGKLKAFPGDVILEASVAPGAAAVTSNGRLKVSTNHPDAEFIDVPFSLRMRPVIEARPAQVRLLLQDGNSAGRTTLFRLQHNLRGEFALTGVKPSNPKIFRAEVVDGDAKQQVHAVAVILQDDVTPGSLDRRVLESLTITTDDPRRPEFVVPVLIESKTLNRPGQSRALE